MQLEWVTRRSGPPAYACAVYSCLLVLLCSDPDIPLPSYDVLSLDPSDFTTWSV